MTLTGQIGLIPHNGKIIPELIALVTHSESSHTVVAISETECLGAEPLGARIRPISDFPTAIWSHFDLTNTQRAAIVNWTYNHEGTPYSYLDDAAIGIALLTGIETPAFVRRYLDSTGHLICSQLADLAYQAAGIQLFDDGRVPGAVYPGSYEPIYKARGWWPNADLR
jgi:hypothetical protein